MDMIHETPSPSRRDGGDGVRGTPTRANYLLSRLPWHLCLSGEARLSNGSSAKCSMKRILALALALRLGFLFYWLHNRMDLTFGRDLYYSLALAWGGWQPLTWMDATHPPLYSLFILGVLKLFHTTNPLPVLLIQCVLSSLVCLVIYILGENLANERVGLIAALWCAIDLPMISFVPQLQTETLFISMEVMLPLWIIWCYTEAADIFIVGLWAGLCALCRSAFAAYPIVPLFVLWQMGKLKQTIPFLILFSMGWATPIALWTYRNWVSYHQIIPMSSQMGWNLYEGFTLDREVVRRHPIEMTAEAKRLGIKDPMVLGQYFFDKTLRQIKARPLWAARTIVGKAFLYWRPWVYDPYTNTERVVLFCYFTCLFAMALLGVWVNWSDSLHWWPVYGIMIYFTMVHSVFATFLRYRLPLEPFLCLLGAVGVDALIRLGEEIYAFGAIFHAEKTWHQNTH